MANKLLIFHDLNDLLHYIAVFAVIAGTWTTLMQYFQNNVTYTAAASFVLFVVADKIAHKVLKVK